MLPSVCAAPPPPPIPVTCADRPTIGGLVIPAVNIRLADGGVDFRSRHQETYAQCWRLSRCQTCGHPTGPTAVLVGGPNQVARRRFDEPPLCGPCAVYASRACPMVAGRQPFYVDRPALSEGRRGRTCPEPGCTCGGYIPADDAVRGGGGEPAHPWYAVFIRRRQWTLTVNDVDVFCSDGGCDKPHRRRIINGAYLTGQPGRVVLVSAPGHGRIWRRLNNAELNKLFPPDTAR